ncbi:MAG: aminotransferase class I/II-fold pyridoxal phosphate-dependent enzyme [Hymenobacteraceae bacterium]|nr:aminotransferase class I/II-fold pyridoxal phosphate-dependent enzyme [Hymenobacteraceae bacterium]
MDHISLASGSSYFSSPDAATDAAIAALQAGKTQYGPTEGTWELRQAISDKYSTPHFPVSPEQVLVTPGTKQALFNLFSVLLRQGDEVVVPTPAWFGFHELMKYSSGMLVPLETSLSEEYAITPEALRKTLNNRSRILLLTNPGNPTGRVYSKAELEAILEVVNEYPNLYLISDEIYDHITYSGSFTPIFSCEGAPRERTILLNGFSKSFAMSGWRLGYMVGPEACIQKSTAFQGSTLSGVSVFLQEAALATLQARETALAPMLDVLQDNRQLMKQALDGMAEVRYYLPDGAYYFFPDLSHYLTSDTATGKEPSTAEGLCRYLRQRFNLDLVPGVYFGGAGHVRMSFAVERPRLAQALQRLAAGLKLLRA